MARGGKGASDVLTTVLLITIVVVAIAVIGVVLNNASHRVGDALIREQCHLEHPYDKAAEDRCVLERSGKSETLGTENTKSVGTTNTTKEFFDDGITGFASFNERIIAGNLNSIAGFVRLSIAPGYSMVANPMFKTNLDVKNIFVNPPNGLTIFKQNAAKTGYDSTSYDPDFGGWTEPMSIAPGEGVWILSPSAYNVTLIGEVPLRASQTIHPGYEIHSVQIPIKAQIQTKLNFPLVNGETIFRRNSAGTGYDSASYDVDFGGWAPNELEINVGESFWTLMPSDAGNKNWTVTLPNSAKGDAPIVDYNITSSGRFNITFIGEPNETYLIESADQLNMNHSAWNVINSFFTNVSRYINYVGDIYGKQRFFRVIKISGDCMAFVDRGIVGYYCFENGFDDSSRHNNDGISHNGASLDVTTASNIVGVFDGVNDYIEIPDEYFIYGEENTVSFWIKKGDIADDHTPAETIIRKGLNHNNEFLINIQNLGDHWNFKSAYSGTNSIGQESSCETDFGNLPNDMRWHQIVQTRDENGVLAWYQDGQKIGEYTTCGINNFYSGNQPIWIGTNYPETNYKMFNGKLDEIMIYNRTLSTTEVRDIYNEKSDLFNELPPVACNDGCLMGSSCVPYGYVNINAGNYCEADTGRMTALKGANAACNRNYECSTGVCSFGGRCVAQSVINSAGGIDAYYVALRSTGSGANITIVSRINQKFNILDNVTLMQIAIANPSRLVFKEAPYLGATNLTINYAQIVRGEVSDVPYYENEETLWYNVSFFNSAQTNIGQAWVLQSMLALYNHDGTITEIPDEYTNSFTIQENSRGSRYKVGDILLARAGGLLMNDIILYVTGVDSNGGVTSVTTNVDLNDVLYNFRASSYTRNVVLAVFPISASSNPRNSNGIDGSGSSSNSEPSPASCFDSNDDGRINSDECFLDADTYLHQNFKPGPAGWIEDIEHTEVAEEDGQIRVTLKFKLVGSDCDHIVLTSNLPRYTSVAKSFDPEYGDQRVYTIDSNPIPNIPASCSIDGGTTTVTTTISNFRNERYNVPGEGGIIEATFNAAVCDSEGHCGAMGGWKSYIGAAAQTLQPPWAEAVQIGCANSRSPPPLGDGEFLVAVTSGGSPLSCEFFYIDDDGIGHTEYGDLHKYRKGCQYFYEGDCKKPVREAMQAKVLEIIDNGDWAYGGDYVNLYGGPELLNIIQSMDIAVSELIGNIYNSYSNGEDSNVFLSPGDVSVSNPEKAQNLLADPSKGIAVAVGIKELAIDAEGVANYLREVEKTHARILVLKNQYYIALASGDPARINAVSAELHELSGKYMRLAHELNTKYLSHFNLKLLDVQRAISENNNKAKGAFNSILKLAEEKARESGGVIKVCGRYARKAPGKLGGILAAGSVAHTFWSQGFNADSAKDAGRVVLQILSGRAGGIGVDLNEVRIKCEPLMLDTHVLTAAEREEAATKLGNIFDARYGAMFRNARNFPDDPYISVRDRARLAIWSIQPITDSEATVSGMKSVNEKAIEDSYGCFSGPFGNCPLLHWILLLLANYTK